MKEMHISDKAEMEIQFEETQVLFNYTPHVFQLRRRDSLYPVKGSQPISVHNVKVSFHVQCAESSGQSNFTSFRFSSSHLYIDLACMQNTNSFLHCSHLDVHVNSA